MQNLMLYCAGILGILISIVHGYLGEFKVVRAVEAPSGQVKRVLQAIMFLSAVYWFAASVLLLITPAFMPSAIRPFLAIGVAVIFLTGSLGNLWATRGSHFGWVLLAGIAGLAFAGA
ncbi:MAG: hypothetical protein AAF862_13890 [Pseudomonadota bacterium]